MEPDECLQLSPAGGRRDGGAGAGLLARQRHRRARRGARARPGARGGFPAGGGPHLLLRQCRHPLRHRDVQDAGVRRAVGRPHAQPLRRHRPQAAPVPLRRAGELAGPDRAAAGEQRLPHPARDAGRGDEQERPRPLGAVAGLERGARPAAPVGPAMVAAPAADRGLRDRPAGIRRHLRRQHRDRPQGRGAEGRGPGRDGAHRRHRRRGGGHRGGLHEAAPGRVQPQAAVGHRGGRADGDRRQRLHRGRALAPVDRRRLDPDRRCLGRARPDRAPESLARRARRRRREDGAGRARGGGQGRPQRHAGLDRLRPGGRDDRRMDR